ncbi:hypothetical protein D3C81_572210 [compost metagenome]
MANTVLHKRSAVTGKAPLAADLSAGELAINTADGDIYTKRDNGTVVKIANTSGSEPVIAAGTTAQFWRGDKTWTDFASTVRAAVLTGLTTATNAAITATDSILVALGKLQAQMDNKLSLAGGILTGALHLRPAGNASIELGRIDGNASTPFIDFHSSATATDFDARIICDGGTGTLGGGRLTYTANAGHIFNGAVQIAALYSPNPVLPFYVGSGALGINVGQVLVSDNYADVGSVPSSGAYLKGRVVCGSTTNSAMILGNTSNNLEVRNGGGTGDSGMAMIAFHCTGLYAAKLGLRSDGYFGLGGWSMDAWRWYVTPAGAMVATSDVLSGAALRATSAVLVSGYNCPHAGMGVGELGTFALCLLQGGGSVAVGQLVAGSNLLWAAASGHNGGVVNFGTWRVMGYVLNADAVGADSVTLCMRVS